MKKILTSIIFVLTFSIINAQTSAMDFNRKDCNGNMHHLFSELDSGNVIIMEFFHTCITCVNAAKAMQPTYQRLAKDYGKKVRYYAAPGDDTGNPCSYVINWITNNGFSSMIIPFDSGAVQTAYYGGSGMPTIAIAAGSAHKLLYLANPNYSFDQKDTLKIETDIRHFLDSTFAGVPIINSAISLSVFPNPAHNNFAVKIQVQEAGILKLELTTLEGKKITDLTNETIQSGIWNKRFPVSLSNGVYLIKGSIHEKQFQQKITILNN